jgi:hypothetical protein
MDDAIESIDPGLSVKDFALAVGKILKGEAGTEGYGSFNFGEFMKVLHAELGMEESLNEVKEMATYKVTVTLAEPGEGGPDYDEDVEVKVDASLSGDELRMLLEMLLVKRVIIEKTSINSSTKKHNGRLKKKEFFSKPLEENVDLAISH